MSLSENGCVCLSLSSFCICLEPNHRYMAKRARDSDPLDDNDGAPAKSRRGASPSPAGLGHANLTATELFHRNSNGTGIIFYSGSKDPQARALSNFAPVDPPRGFEVDGAFFPTVEHFYQSLKVNQLGLEGLAEEIRLLPASQAADAKKLGGRAGCRRHLLSLSSSKTPPKLQEAFNSEEATKGKKLTQKEKESVVNAFLAAEMKRHFPSDAALARLMRRGLEAKFNTPQMKELLLGTGKRPLAEKRGKADAGGWQLRKDGEPGRLGQLLMAVRAKLRGEEEEGEAGREEEGEEEED